MQQNLVFSFETAVHLGQYLFRPNYSVRKELKNILEPDIFCLCRYGIENLIFGKTYKTHGVGIRNSIRFRI